MNPSSSQEPTRVSLGFLVNDSSAAGAATLAAHRWALPDDSSNRGDKREE